MCNRYVYKHPAIELEDYFDLKIARAEVARLVAPRYSIAPSETVAGIRMTGAGQPEWCGLTWGFVPAWARDPKAGPRPLNARSETAAAKPAFRDALAQRRCLLPASGFYEWHRDGLHRPLPYYFSAHDGAPLAFAGIWEYWGTRDDGRETCCLLTTAANGLMGKIHDRMPVLLHPRNFARWLDPSLRDPDKVTDLFAPAPDDYLISHPVLRRINRVGEQGEDLIAPVKLENANANERQAELWGEA